MTEGGRKWGELTSAQRDERAATGLAAAEANEHAGGEEGTTMREESRRLSQEELRQLRERARARLSDPDYQRRVKNSDGFIESLIKKLGR